MKNTKEEWKRHKESSNSKKKPRQETKWIKNQIEEMMKTPITINIIKMQTKMPTAFKAIKPTPKSLTKDNPTSKTSKVRQNKAHRRLNELEEQKRRLIIKLVRIIYVVRNKINLNQLFPSINNKNAWKYTSKSII